MVVRSPAPASHVLDRTRVGHRLRVVAAVLAVGVVIGGCASAGRVSPTPLTIEEWTALATPRPEARPSAAHVSIGGIEIVGDLGWPPGADTSLEFVVEELVAAGLLRRGDVRFVERRRFTRAARLERMGAERPAGAPPVGVSAPADFLASATWISFSAERSTIEVRLANSTTGGIAASTRIELEHQATVLDVSRGVVGGVLEALDRLGRLPRWEDPLAGSDGTTGSVEVEQEALLAFAAGLAAEDAFQWERARMGYQSALRDERFHEAGVALARTARLRLGGTLGES